MENNKKLEDFLINMKSLPIVSPSQLGVSSSSISSVFDQYTNGFQLKKTKNSTKGIFLPISFFETQYLQSYTSGEFVDFFDKKAKIFSFKMLYRGNFETQSKSPILTGISKELSNTHSFNTRRNYQLIPTWAFFDLQPNSKGYSAREYLTIN